MATFTVLITVPTKEAPSASSDLEEHLKRVLEEGVNGWPGFTVAAVDVIRGDHLLDTKAGMEISKAHRADWPEHYRR